MTENSASISANPVHSRDRLSNEIQRISLEIESIQRDSHNKDSRLAQLYNERGHMKYLQVEFTSAVKDFTIALELQPTLATAFYNRGLIHYRLARFDKSIQDMKSALQLQPDFESAHSCLKQAQEDRDAKSK